MASISTKGLARELLSNKGIYETDPQVKVMYSYISRQSNQKCYAVFYDETHDDLHGYDTEFCKDVALLMKNGELTQLGIEELKELE